MDIQTTDNTNGSIKIKVAVVGAAGFAGVEAVRILLGHPSFDLVAATSDANAGEKIANMYPAFAGVTDMKFCTSDTFMKTCGCEGVGDVTGETKANANGSAKSLAGAGAYDCANISDEANAKVNASPKNTQKPCDIAFLAVPHTAALSLAPRLLKAGVSVIDLSADFRLEDPDVYERWYETKHTSPDLLSERAFGLPELFVDDLDALAQRRAQGEAVLVGCAGCYPTATSLAAAPACRAGLVYTKGTVVVDAISGVTGAGKKATARTHFCFANENLEAYGIAKHRHTPEIAQILGLDGGDGAGVASGVNEQIDKDGASSACGRDGASIESSVDDGANAKNNNDASHAGNSANDKSDNGKVGSTNSNRARLVFTPHLAPLNRGLLSTVNIPLDPEKPAPSQAEIDQMYEKFYSNACLVTYVGAQSPRTASVAGTCRAQVSATVNTSAHMLVCVGAIDNLGKGAAGQAVQCANIVCGLPETTGLDMIACPV